MVQEIFLTKEENIVTDRLVFAAIFEYFNQIHVGFFLSFIILSRILSFILHLTQCIQMV